MASRLLDVLATDHVLSVAQLERHLGVSEAEARALGARVFVVSLSKTKGSTLHDHHRFVMPKGKQAPEGGGTVRHITGAAEMRFLLGAPHDAWVSDAGKKRSKSKPDATWTTPEGVIAIEYDAGSYDPGKIEGKLMSFKTGYAAQIWGTPSRKRVGHIKDIAANIVPDLHVFYAPWF